MSPDLEMASRRARRGGPQAARRARVRVMALHCFLPSPPLRGRGAGGERASQRQIPSPSPQPSPPEAGGEGVRKQVTGFVQRGPFMFVQLNRDLLGKKAGERIDLAEGDAAALLQSGAAAPVGDDA